MKEIVVVFALLFTFVAASAQVTTIDIASTDTTSKLPAGTYAKDGNILMAKGYKAVYSKDRKAVIIRKMKPNGGLGETSGAFRCYCVQGDDDCGATYGPYYIKCESKKSKCSRCELIVATDPKLTAILAEGGALNDATIKWSRVVFPTKSK